MCYVVRAAFSGMAWSFFVFFMTGLSSSRLALFVVCLELKGSHQPLLYMFS